MQYFTGNECNFRLGIFLTNFRLIQEFNSNKKSYKIGLNRFSCYTSSEYKSLLGHKQISIQLKHQQYPKLNDDIPDFSDSRIEKPFKKWSRKKRLSEKLSLINFYLNHNSSAGNSFKSIK